MQASHSLGVSDETRISIENKICREGGPLPDCFEEPMENVLTLLEEVKLLLKVAPYGFLKSKKIQILTSKTAYEYFEKE